jgi:hypothetical protein
MPIRAEHDGINLVFMAVEDNRRSRHIGQVPQPDRVVAAARGQSLAVWAKGNGMHDIFVASQENRVGRNVSEIPERRQAIRAT